MDTKTCKKCGRELPATLEYFYRGNRSGNTLFRSPCKECCKAILDPEYEAAYDKAYRDSHKEQLQEQHRKYWIKNKEIKCAYKRANQERFTQTHREYVEKHRDSVRAKTKEWEIVNREKRNEQARIHGNKRRAQKADSGGTVTREDIRAQFERQKGKCYYCGNPAGEHYHADHVVPLSRGGAHIPSNIVIACPACNSKKNAKLPHEWAEGGRLL